MNARENELSALLISPDRGLAEEFSRSLFATPSFQILADLKTYPTEQALDLRLKQLKPDVLLIDLATSLDEACETVRYASAARPPVLVIGLHHTQHADAIVRSLRLGATEFLASPFEVNVQQEAVVRIRRMRQPEASAEPELAKLVAFSSTKPGSGASTLAAQSAFALRRITGKRVLLADFDLMGGTIGFYLKLHHTHSLMDALSYEGRLDAMAWASLVLQMDGVDILPSPEEPASISLEQSRLHDVLELARRLYDYVVLDLPTIFHRTSLTCLAEIDHAYLVTTAELPSLHLTRKALSMLGSLGFERSRYQVVVNRLNRKDGFGGGDLGKMFSVPIHATFPNDYFSLHRVVTRGEPLSGDGDLGKAIEGLAAKLCGSVEKEKNRAAGFLGARPALSQT